MGQPDTEEEGANETPSSRKNSSGPRRVSSATSGGSGRSGGWRKLLLCCLKPADDEVQELDYRHCSLNDVPPEVFTHERTLEVLYLDCNQITDLPRPLFHCHGLEELWLSDNEIVRLPHALASLINLKVRRAPLFWLLAAPASPLAFNSFNSSIPTAYR
jgi:Leucine-rich repeat (LRR) protein